MPFECQLNVTKVLSKNNRQKTLLLSLSSNKFIQSHSIYMINLIYLSQRVLLKVTVDIMASTSIQKQSVCSYLNLNLPGALMNHGNKTMRVDWEYHFLLYFTCGLFWRSMGSLESPHFVPDRLLIFSTRPNIHFPSSTPTHTTYGSTFLK